MSANSLLIVQVANEIKKVEEENKALRSLNKSYRYYLSLYFFAEKNNMTAEELRLKIIKNDLDNIFYEAIIKYFIFNQNGSLIYNDRYITDLNELIEILKNIKQSKN